MKAVNTKQSIPEVATARKEPQEIEPNIEARSLTLLCHHSRHPFWLNAQDNISTALRKWNFFLANSSIVETVKNRQAFSRISTTTGFCLIAQLHQKWHNLLPVIPLNLNFVIFDRAPCSAQRLQFFEQVSQCFRFCLKPPNNRHSFSLTSTPSRFHPQILLIGWQIRDRPLQSLRVVMVAKFWVNSPIGSTGGVWFWRWHGRRGGM